MCSSVPNEELDNENVECLIHCSRHRHRRLVSYWTCWANDMRRPIQMVFGCPKLKMTCMLRAIRFGMAQVNVRRVIGVIDHSTVGHPRTRYQKHKINGEALSCL